MVSGTPFVKRHHLNLGADYALRLIRIFTDVFDGDVSLALVFIAAAQMGTRHLRDDGDYFDKLEGEFFPDHLRQPVTVSALARSLGLPVETTRRHVVRLASTGYALRTEQGGVIVTSDALRREEIRKAGLANLDAIQVLADGLQRAPRGR